MRIILLSDQERLIRLFSRPGALPGAQLHVASSVEDALTAVAAKAPHLIFIQERLGEVSGEMLASRLANGPKGNRSRIVLIGDPSVAASAAKRPHLVLDASLSDEQLAEAVRGAVSLSLPGAGKRRSVKRSKPVRVEAALPAEPAAAPLPTETIADVVALGGGAVSSPGAVFTQHTAIPVPEVPPGACFEKHLENALEGSRAELQPAAHPEPPAPDVAAAADAPALPSRIAGSRKVVIGLLSMAGLALIIFLALHGQRRGEGIAPEKAAQGGGSTARNPATGPNSLPSFIPGQARDSAYGAAHPGWERYLAPAAEFRVYRENGLIRAIQCIDRGNGGIAPVLFDAALKELAGSGGYLVESSERKGSYLVEKGRLQNGAGVIVYRREPERRVKAFVVDLRN